MTFKKAATIFAIVATCVIIFTVIIPWRASQQQTVPVVPPPSESVTLPEPTIPVEEPVTPTIPEAPPLTEWQEAAIEHVNPEPVLSAEVTVGGWREDYDEWGNLLIVFEVKNTGNVDIRCVDIQFTVICKDGTQFSGRIMAFGKGEHAIVDVENKEVESVEIEDYKIYKYFNYYQ